MAFLETVKRVVSAPEKALSRLFFLYGKFVATHAWKVLIVSFIFSGVLCVGSIRRRFDFKTENALEAFIARGTELGDDYERIEKQFPIDMTNYHPVHSFGVPEATIVWVRGEGNLLEGARFLELSDICAKFEALSANVDGENLLYSSDKICSKFDGDCNRPLVCSLILAGTPVFPTEAASLMGFLNPVSEVRDIPVLGNISVIVYAEEMNLFWYTLETGTASEWSVEIFEDLDDLRKTYTASDYYIFSYARSRYEERQMLANDMYLFIIGIFLLMLNIIFVSINLSLKRSRIPLALCGFFSTLLSLGAAFGILIAIGVPFIGVSIVIPFIVIGIGVDAVLVLMTEWASMPHLPAVERIGKTMEAAFMGITLSHLTSVIAFFFGLISPFKAVDYICVYMAVSIIMMWIGEGTFFLACLSLHNRYADKLDDSYDKSEEQSADGIKGYDVIKKCKRHPDTSFAEAFLKWVLPILILNKATKVIALVGLGVGFGFACVSVVNMPRTEEYSIYLEDGSSVGQFYDVRSKHWQFTRKLTVVFDKTLDYSDPATYEEIQNYFQYLYNTSYFVEFGVNWYDTFLAYEQATGQNSMGNKTAFMTSLVTFVEFVLPNAPDFEQVKFLSEDVVFNSDKSDVRRSRFYVSLLMETGGPVALSEDILKIISNSKKEFKHLGVYVTDLLLTELERTVILRGQVWMSIAIVAAAAAVVTFIFVPQPIAYLLVLVSFIAAMVSAMGLMHAWGMTYTLAVYMQILLGFGLCIDYMAHVARGYMTAPGDGGHERASHMLEVIGVAMANAAVTSIVGIVMLAAAKAYAVRTFFQSMFLIYLCSFVFGVVFLPVVLSLWGSAGFEDQPANRVKAEDVEDSTNDEKDMNTKL